MKDQSVFSTTFVSILLAGFWNRYKEKIFHTQFLPFMIYMAAMMAFLIFSLEDGVREQVYFSAVYYPLFGFCFLLNAHQCLNEQIQLQNLETYAEYFLSVWNMNDLIYLALNTLVMLSSITGNLIPLDVERNFAAISIICLWFKVYDWLRLFNDTAFFVRLIEETFLSIKSFLIVIFVFFMMFGSAFYVINMNLADELSVMPNFSHFWFINAF